MEKVEWLLKGKPYEVQRLADERAGFNKGYLYWLEQGLGKTATALQNWLRWKNRKNGLSTPRLIIVAPNSMCMTWKQEIEEWIDEKLNVEVWSQKPLPNPDVFIVNYEALAGQGKGWGRGFDRAHYLIKQTPSMLIVDEAHKIKNPSSRWSKSVLALAKDCVARRGLTGTPMSQSVMDLYPQLKLACELNGMNSVVFRNRYAIRGGYMGKVIVGINEHTQPELQRIMNRCSFRALKSEWSDLPEKLPPTIITLDLPQQLVKHYRTMLADFLVEIDGRSEDDLILAQMVITQMGKLQQISSGFIYDEFKNINVLMDLSKTPKYKALKDIIENLDKSKMLVFCHYKPTSNFLIKSLSDDFGSCAYLIGGMSSSEMEEQKVLFNSDDGPQIMVAQVSVGSAGHTLLGGENFPCYTTAFFENNFSLVDREQSSDRNHRYGQKHSVNYYDFVSSGIERKVIDALHKKKSLVKALIDARNSN